MNRRHFLGAMASLSAGLTASLRAAPAGDAKFKLGIVTYNIAKDWDVETILDVCKETGMSAVEFRSTHKHGVEPTLSKARRKEIKKMFADGGIQIYGCGTACEFHSPDPAVVKKNIESCKRFVELTKDIGGTGVKVRPNGLPKGVAEEKTLEQIGKSLIPCGQAAKDAGVEIHVEVHGRDTAHPPRVKKIMDHCGHQSVGLTWNCNPDDIQKGSVKEYFNLLWPWIRNCHIHELNAKYPYKEFFGLLKQKGYDRLTLIEIGRTEREKSNRVAFLKKYKEEWERVVKKA